MPTPIEILLDPISLMILSLYGSLMLWELLFPGRKLPYVKYWKLRGMVVFVFYFFFTSYLPMFINPLLETYRLFDWTGLGTLWGGIVAILLYELGVCIWHFLLHRSDFLWRTFHQMHHSAERLDTYGAFYFSPLDMVGWTVLGSICFSLIAGLSAPAITVMLLVTNFFNIFQHANINTPRWLGYIVQRPESHTIHHAKGIHQYNYSDLPLFDIIFGTFKNPEGFIHETGFYNGASSRIWDILRGKDISQPNAK